MDRKCKSIIIIRLSVNFTETAQNYISGNKSIRFWIWILSKFKTFKTQQAVKIIGGFENMNKNLHAKEKSPNQKSAQGRLKLKAIRFFSWLLGFALLGLTSKDVSLS